VTSESVGLDGALTGKRVVLGTTGRLATLLWSFALVLFASPERFFAAAALVLAVNLLLYPRALGQLLRWRWLFFACLLVLPSVFWGAEPSAEIGGVPVSLDGLVNGLGMLLRAIVIMVAVGGFATAVDVSEVAGLLERAGLPGLGFSMGVAVNLLPSLQHSSQTVWRTLQMRGGLRRERRRAAQLVLVTVVANALRRAEEIALAAEVRGFTPQKARAMPLRAGSVDGLLVLGLLLSWLAIMFIHLD
jgi:energy-coupling factor transporter transmembrane protein EcfT